MLNLILTFLLAINYNLITLPSLSTSIFMVEKEIKVTVTCYTPSKDETDDTPLLTANMERPIPFRTCAVSRDLKHFIGKYIYIDDFHVLKVNDLMNKRFKKSIDIVFDNKQRCLEFGKKKRKILILDKVFTLNKEGNNHENSRKDAGKHLYLIFSKWFNSNGNN